MNTYKVELFGTITRDIKWVECGAADEDEARQICAHEMPLYRVNKVELASGPSDGTTPATVDGSDENPTS